MGFWNFFFSKKLPSNPKGFQQIFVRWDSSGKEYGPYPIKYIVEHGWSNHPTIGRFENEKKWRDFGYFLNILDQLHASDEQLDFLKGQSVEFDEVSIGFIEANRMIEAHNRLLMESRASARKERELLPATRIVRKKLDELGIKYPESVTRAEAKALIAQYKDKQLLQSLKENLAKFSVIVPDVENFNEYEVQLEDGMSLLEHIGELASLLNQLDKSGLSCPISGVIDLNALPELNNSIEAAIDDAESAIDELKERKFFVSYEEYKLVGTLPKKQLKELSNEIIRLVVAGRWDFDRNILACIEKYLPEVRVKVIED